jgi:hypothetical protein
MTLLDPQELASPQRGRCEGLGELEEGPGYDLGVCSIKRGWGVGEGSDLEVRWDEGEAMIYSLLK